MPLFLEVFLRFSSIGILATVCLLIFIHGMRPRILICAVFFNVSLICYLLVWGSYPWALHSANTHPAIFFVIYMISRLTIFSAWLFTLAIFDEEVRITPTTGLLLSALALLPLLEAFVFLGYFSLPQIDLWGPRFLYLFICHTLIVHVIYKALAGYPEDLLEKRRKYRISFSVAISLLMFTVSAVFEIKREFIQLDLSYSFLLIGIFSIAMALWALKLHPQTLALKVTKLSHLEASALDTGDHAMLRQLEALMEAEHIYRKQGLTISKLAQIMEVPDHKLRAFINGKLGYRNFSSFLNRYRIAEAEARLADPEEAHIPVLTIALSAGFSSISPFNTAFKAAVGMTPTKYREKFYARNEADQNSAT